MSDLFKKLNVLVRSSINEVLGADLPLAELRRRLTPERLGPHIDREVAALRQRINDALAYETELQSKVTALQDEVARWDRQADAAILAGNDAVARHAVVQMQRAQQRLAMAQADLRDHQQVAAELIDRVNMLEAAVADARQAQAQQPVEVEAPASEPEALEHKPLSVPPLADVLRDAREKIGQMGDLLAAQTETVSGGDTSAPAAPPESAADDDLAARRQRLSKPGS